MRMKFCKTGDAVYFSHLDLNRAILRAIRRSGIPYWSKGGFNPHPYCVFAQPLSLGFESEGELLDFRLLPDGELNPEQLKKAFPPNLAVVEIYEPKDSFKEIAYAEYAVEIETTASAEEVEAAFSEELTVLKKTKRSEQQVALSEFIQKVRVEQAGEGACRIIASLAAGNQRSLSPNYLEEGLVGGGIDCKITRVRRLRFLKEDGAEIY